MAERGGELRRTLPAFGAAVPIVIMFVGVLSITLTSAGPEGLALSPAETSTWIVVLYGWPALPAVVMSVRYRQPLLYTGNVFAVIFFGTLGSQLGYREVAGAAFVAGAIVLVIAVFGLTEHLARWVPAAIVHGLVAGAVLPFVVDIFTALSTTDDNGDDIRARVPLMVASTLVAYLLSRRFLGTRVPAIFPALAAGVAMAGVTGQFGAVPSSFALPDVELGWPEFSWQAIASATPVLVALIYLQSNLPCLVYMRSQGFDPPERAVNVVSGVGTMAGAAIGPSALALAVPLAALSAGPSAGEQSIRYRAVYLPAVALVVIALLAGTASELATLVPPVLLRARAGIALIAVLVGSLQQIAKGPLLLGPTFAFAVSVSHMRLFDLGPFFWSLVLGVAVSLLLERDEWKQLSASSVG